MIRKDEAGGDSLTDRACVHHEASMGITWRAITRTMRIFTMEHR
ncbi:MAG: hypothetical protein Q4C47_05510 [Planctomycetia bacterium]|nr:hypothetical protein [Planctomycetia bacterium]